MKKKIKTVKKQDASVTLKELERFAHKVIFPLNYQKMEARVYKLETIVKILAEKMKVNIEEMAGAE